MKVIDKRSQQEQEQEQEQGHQVMGRRMSSSHME
jgi:hypothetical protein